MNIFDAIINAQNGAAVRQVGSQVGLDETQTAAALSALMPALAAGFQQKAQTQGDLGSLLSGLGMGNHQQYLDKPSTLADETAVTEGNGILGQILGSKDVSREVASRAATQTGLSTEVMKRLLPLVATLMMGAISRRAGATSMAGGLAGPGGGLADMLGPLLDRNRDGSIMDDVTSMLGQGLKRQ